MTQPTPDYTAEQLRRLAEIEMRTAELELEKAEAAQHESRASGLVPDFGAVKDSTIEQKSDQPAFSTVLSHQAMKHAAAAVAEALPASIRGRNILVTADPDLTAPTGTYRSVAGALSALESVVSTALEPAPDDGDDRRRELLGATALAGIGAVSKAIPGVLSMLAAKRSLLTAAVAKDDLSAGAEVVKKAKAKHTDAKFFHDTFRVTPEGSLSARIDALGSSRVSLVALRDQLLGADQADHVVKARTELCTSAIAAIDTFVSTVHSTTGTARSLATTAALYEQLCTPAAKWLVLLVKSGGGTATQLVDNRPAFFDDKIFVMVEVGITYVLIDTDDSQIAASGCETGIASLRGDIDSDIEVR